MVQGTLAGSSTPSALMLVVQLRSCCWCQHPQQCMHLQQDPVRVQLQLV